MHKLTTSPHESRARAHRIVEENFLSAKVGAEDWRSAHVSRQSEKKSRIISGVVAPRRLQLQEREERRVWKLLPRTRRLQRKRAPTRSTGERFIFYQRHHRRRHPRRQRRLLHSLLAELHLATPCGDRDSFTREGIAARRISSCLWNICIFAAREAGKFASLFTLPRFTSAQR